ncbi:hypothetical protein V1291_004131 [Nitrobacteraceae bacterium AZCC 1564]
MFFRASIFSAVLCFLALLPAIGEAVEVDTEHMFGFMIGSDVGDVGEREVQSKTTARLSKSGGTYRAISQALELEFVPAKNFRVEFGGTLAANNINNVPGFSNTRQFDFQGAAAEFRYRFLDRETASFGLTFGVGLHADRIDETTAARVRGYGTEFVLAFDRELLPDRVVAAFNLLYEPEWTSPAIPGAAIHRESTIGAAAALMVQVHPGVFIGGEARYLRQYEGINLGEFSGDAVFIGPTAFVKLSERSRLTAAWSFQVSGSSVEAASHLNLVEFERHQARLIFGVNF